MKQMKLTQSFAILFAIVALILIVSCNDSIDSTVIEPTDKPFDPIVHFNDKTVYGTMTDQDGNEYKTITIGKRTWMAENLRTTKYRNGELIANVTDSLAWKALSTAAYCNYNNTTNVDSIKVLGRLYNWYSVLDTTRNIAPKGWHVADTMDWKALYSDTLKIESLSGITLKEAGGSHWNGNRQTLNSIGFTAIPAGYRQESSNNAADGVRAGYFANLGNCTVFWMTKPKNGTDGFGINIVTDGDGAYGMAATKIKYKPRFGFSIRCVKDL